MWARCERLVRVNSNHSIRTLARRVLGALVLALSFLPVFRVLDSDSEAPFRIANIEIAEVTLLLAWWGTLSTVLVGVVMAALFKGGPVRRLTEKAGRLLCTPKLPVFAIAVSLLAGALALFTWRYLYLGLLTNVDEIASTVRTTS